MYTNLFDAEARVAAIHPIDMIGDPENPPAWVDQFAENCDNAARAVFTFLDELKPIGDLDMFEDDRTHARAIADAFFLAERKGFIVHADIQCRRYVSETSFYSGWGHYRSVFLYAATIDDVLPVVLKTATAFHELEMTEFQSKAGA